MNSDSFIGNANNFEIRDNYLDVWNDILLYASNINGNWLFSQQIFYETMVPTAEKNPARFARWINEMVKTSGVKIKSRAGFIKSLNYLRKIKRKNKNNIKMALFEMLESGLNQPLYALRAIKNRHIAI